MPSSGVRLTAVTAISSIAILVNSTGDCLLRVQYHPALSVANLEAAASIIRPVIARSEDWSDPVAAKSST